LVGSPVFWREPAGACVLIAEAVQRQNQQPQPGGVGSFAARSTPTNPPRRDSIRNSIRCRHSAKPARPSSTASGTKAGVPARGL
jgi:hypothetical protein